MKRKIRLSESEFVNLLRKVLLEQETIEQVVQGKGSDPYEYKKEGNKYYTRRKGSSSWIETKGNVADAIATKIFKVTVGPPKTTTTTKTTVSLPPANVKRPDINVGSDTSAKIFQGSQRGVSEDSYMKMQEFISKFPPSKKSSLPLHIRALMDYLGGRTKTFTAADLTKDEQNFLKTVAIQNAKKGLTYPLWKEIGAGNLPTAMTVSGSEKEKQKLTDKGGQSSLLKPELAGQFMYTLGEISPTNIEVTPNKTKVTLYDRYDFNTKGKTKEDLIKSFVEQVGSWWNGKSTFYSVIRNAVAFKEITGYKGFPVDITV